MAEQAALNGHASWTWEEASTAARARALAVEIAGLERLRIALAQARLPLGDTEAQLQEAYGRHLEVMAEARRLRPRGATATTFGR
jgi:hypothetical protein